MDSQEKLSDNIPDWLNSFGPNQNTGIEAEKKTGIQILLQNGLDTPANLPDKYRNLEKHYNPSRSNKIKGLENLSQVDTIGGTADIRIHYTDKPEVGVSVTLWNRKIEKCLRNPSGKKHYNLEKTPELEKLNDESYNEAIKHRKKMKGDNPKNWKRCSNCPGTKSMCEHLANAGSTEWNKMQQETKLQNLYTFLDLDSNGKTKSDCIAFWNEEDEKIHCVFNWELKIDLKDYLDTEHDGIYIYHGTKKDHILKTQVKYNNGIIEIKKNKDNDTVTYKKSNNYLSSWNVKAPNLNKIFKMTSITL